MDERPKSKSNSAHVSFEPLQHLPNKVGRDFSFVDEAGQDGFVGDVLIYIGYSGAVTTPEQRREILEALRGDPRPLKVSVSQELIYRGLFPDDRRPMWNHDGALNI